MRDSCELSDYILLRIQTFLTFQINSCIFFRVLGAEVYKFGFILLLLSILSEL